MPLLKWLREITQDLFITAERPIFIVSDKADSEDLSNNLCHLLAILGADVVNIKNSSRLEYYTYHYCDGFFETDQSINTITVYFTKTCPKNKNKTYKKTFSLSSYNFAGRVHKV